MIFQFNTKAEGVYAYAGPLPDSDEYKAEEAKFSTFVASQETQALRECPKCPLGPGAPCNEQCEEVAKGSVKP